ncbi:MFS transporter [Pseudomonas sp. NFR16]|uniref:MFS transporter n=1 Tax=Pseudomonas sp. NFR16 TaxID=1566248 RepID=UPI0008C98DB2|nr:MFS transporter [Pseudomonas sp. NFR16]SEI44015.1 Predicted arabinose efflux permease, MFS family [Pseudomonas sp. NFR16]
MQVKETAVQRSDWLSVMSLTAGTFMLVTSELMPVGLLDPIAAELDISRGHAGWMITAPGMIAALVAPFASLLARAVDRRLLLVALSLMVAIADTVVAFAPNVLTLLAGRMLLGASVAGFWTFAAAVGRRLVTQRSGDRAVTIILMGISVGTVMGVPAGTMLGDATGWRCAFITIACIAGAVALAQSLLLPALPMRQILSLRDLGRFLLIPQASLGYLACALGSAGHFAAYTFLAPFLTQQVGLQLSQLGWTLAACGVAGGIGTFAAGVAAQRRLSASYMISAIVMAGSIAAASITCAEPLASVAATVLWGTAFASIQTCIQIWTFRVAPERFEIGSALMVTVYHVALAAGSFAGGELVDRLGIDSAFTLGSLLALACVIPIAVSNVRFPRPTSTSASDT